MIHFVYGFLKIQVAQLTPLAQITPLSLMQIWNKYGVQIIIGHLSLDISLCSDSNKRDEMIILSNGC